MFLAISSFLSLMLILGNILTAFSCFTKLNVIFIACFSFIFCLLVLYKNLSFVKFSYYSLALLIVSVLIFFNFSPVSFGGQDPGVYVSFAGTLANKGTYEDTVHKARIDNRDKKILFKESNNQEPSYNGIIKRQKKYMSTFLISPSILLAEGFLFFSRNSSFLINSIFCILAAFSFFYFCLEIFDKKISFALTLLLCLSPAQIFFGKAPFSEIPAQFFILNSFLSLIYLRKEFGKGEMFLNVKTFLLMTLTGLFLACAALYRPELFVLFFMVVFVLPFFKATLTAKERNILIFFQIYIVLFLVLTDYLEFKTGSIYMQRVTIQEAFYLTHTFAYVAFCFFCSMFFYLKTIRNFLNSLYSWFCEFLNKETIFCLFSLVVIILLAGGFVYRIMFLGLHEHFLPEANAVVKTFNEMIFHRLAVLTGIPFLAASFFGIYLFIKNKASSFLPFYILLLLYGAYASRLFIIQSNSPQLYFAVRRYLPCMIPVIVLFGAYAILHINFFKKKLNNSIFAAGLYLVSLLPMLYLSIPQIIHSEMGGSLSFVENIEKIFNKESFVFIGDAKDKHFLQQLKFLGGYDIYLIPSLLKDNKIDEEKISALKHIEKKLKRKGIYTLYIFLDDFKKDYDLETKSEFIFNYKRVGEEYVQYPQTFYNFTKNVFIGKLKS